MKRDIGNKKCPIWLLGDSAPSNWENYLGEPFDSRHPIRHNIITSVFDVIQDTIYRENRKRIEMSKIYIRNAVEKASIKPKSNVLEWNKKELIDEMKEFKKLFDENTPRLILTFGAFSYEFINRALKRREERKYKKWGTKELGEEFRNNINLINDEEPIILPLLHRSISGGRFLQSHDYYCKKPGANYFDYVGKEISKIIIREFNDSDIWIR